MGRQGFGNVPHPWYNLPSLQPLSQKAHQQQPGLSFPTISCLSTNKEIFIEKKVLKYFLSFIRLGGGEFGEIPGSQCRDLLLFRLVVTILPLRLVVGPA